MTLGRGGRAAAGTGAAAGVAGPSGQRGDQGQRRGLGRRGYRRLRRIHRQQRVDTEILGFLHRLQIHNGSQDAGDPDARLEQPGGRRSDGRSGSPPALLSTNGMAARRFAVEEILGLAGMQDSRSRSPHESLRHLSYGFRSLEDSGGIPLVYRGRADPIGGRSWALEQSIGRDSHLSSLAPSGPAQAKWLPAPFQSLGG